MASRHSWIRCFKSGMLAGPVSYTWAFRQPHRKGRVGEDAGKGCVAVFVFLLVNNSTPQPQLPPEATSAPCRLTPVSTPTSLPDTAEWRKCVSTATHFSLRRL
jgi:hypothetical protein